MVVDCMKRYQILSVFTVEQRPCWTIVPFQLRTKLSYVVDA